MRSILVIRFGALGDLCLLAGALARAALAPGAGERRVTLVAKAAFAPLLAHAAGVDRVVPLAGGGPGAVARLAGRLRAERWDTVVDAHHILRGHLLLALLRRRPDVRLRKDTVARLALLRSGRDDPRLRRTMRDRFAELLPAVAGAGPIPAVAPPALAALARPRPAGPAVLGLAPGARWSTKRWPQAHFAALVQAHHAAGGGPVRIFLGPQEEAWYGAGPLATAAGAAGAEVVRGLPLTEVAARLAECAVLVTNDSGLLHLAEAVGTPVVALFGPTVQAFGYAPHLPQSRLLETDLDCRPCSRNGKRPCHRGDLACLVRLDPAAVLAAAAPLLQGPSGKDPA
ncbi:MAG: glycosyltransferase family 9 protein [Candidatus Krumholzibacteriia bacterium]